jgi:hypothetical protein
VARFANEEDRAVRPDNYTQRWNSAQEGFYSLINSHQRAWLLTKMICFRLWIVALWSIFVGLVVGTIDARTAEPPQLSPGELVHKAVANEIAPDPARFMFRSRKQSLHGSQTHIYVQSQNATAGILIAVNNQPLDLQQRQSEEGRLDYLAHNPSELKRKRKQEKDDSDRITRILAAMPDAFTYTFDGFEEGRPGIGGPGRKLIRLKFHADPAYNPPSRVEQVLTGMQGYILIDPNNYRIAKIDGTLYKDVGFGWGILGHLDKGGRFVVDQGEAGDGSWVTTGMKLNFTGKVLLFKSLAISSNEEFSDYRRVPGTLSFADAVAMLKREAAEVARTNHQ